MLAFVLAPRWFEPRVKVLHIEGLALRPGLRLGDRSLPRLPDLSVVRGRRRGPSRSECRC